MTRTRAASLGFIEGGPKESPAPRDNYWVMARTGRPAKRRTVAALAALTLLAAACGSTVPASELAGSQVAGPAGDGGLGGPAQGPSGGPGGPTGTGETGTGTGGTTTLPPPGGGPTPGLDPAVAPPGVTADTIYVGAGYSTDQGAANAAAGGVEADQGDYRDYYNVMIKRLNDAGGLLGRKIEPVYYEYKALTGQQNTMDQEACETYTRDNEVFLIIGTGDIMNECAKDAGTLQFGAGGATKETYEQNPQRIDVEGVELIRQGRITVDGVRRRGYFEPGARIGLVTWDEPNYRRGLEEGYIAELSRLGLAPAIEPAYLTTPDSLQGLGQTGADASSAILRFADAGITHVFLFDGPAGLCIGGCITIEWLNAAESQRYRPRYGFNVGNAAPSFYEGGEVPREQVRRSISVEWLDVTAADDVGWRLNQPRERCYKIMAEAGYASEDGNAQVAMADACSTFWFLELILNRIQGPLSVAAAIDSVNSLGYAYQSTLSYYNYFSPEQHDGTAGARLVQFMDDCECFEYVTGAYKV